MKMKEARRYEINVIENYGFQLIMEKPFQVKLHQQRASN